MQRRLYAYPVQQDDKSHVLKQKHNRSHDRINSDLQHNNCCHRERSRRLPAPRNCAAAAALAALAAAATSERMLTSCDAPPETPEKSGPVLVLSMLPPGPSSCFFTQKRFASSGSGMEALPLRILSTGRNGPEKE